MQKVKIQSISLYLTFILMNVGLLFKSYQNGPFRYLIYSPILLGLFFLIINKFKIAGLNIKKFPVNGAFSILLVSGLFHFYDFTFIGISQLFFILSALFPIIIYRQLNVNWKYVSLIFILGYLLLIFQKSIVVNFSLSSFFSSNISNIETNQHPFVFGLLSLLFLYKKNKIWFLINLFFVILSFKRIVFLGVLISIPFVLFDRNDEIFFKNKRFLFLAVNVLLVFIIFSFTIGIYDNFIRNYTGFSPGQFTSGRQAIYEIIYENFQNSTLLEKLIGNGQGFTFQLTMEKIKNAPHNDLLTLLLDHGLIIFVLFITLIYKSKILFPVIYLNILFITDNTITYTFFLFVFFLTTQNLVKVHQKY